MKKYTFLAFLTIITTSVASNAVKLNYSDMGIADDDIAAAIKAPKPPSVTDAINVIKGAAKPEDVEEVDFSSNHITIRGAAQIIEFCSKSLPNIKVLNLSFNKIYEPESQESEKDFTAKLNVLLAKSTFQAIDLRVNNIAALAWFNRTSEVVGLASSKINWKNSPQ